MATLKQEKKSRSILIIGIFFLLAVGSWIAFDVYRSLVETTVPKVLQQQVEPLNPKLDAAAMASLRLRRQFSKAFLLTVRSRSIEALGPARAAPILELLSAGQEATLSATLPPVVATVSAAPQVASESGGL